MAGWRWHGPNIVPKGTKRIGRQSLKRAREALTRPGAAGSTPPGKVAPAIERFARISFLSPVGKWLGTERCAAALGLPKDTGGIGTDPSDADVNCVSATPVAARRYGIDALAEKTWNARPDLVVSGANEGNSTGHINASSGTFNHLVYAVNRNRTAMQTGQLPGDTGRHHRGPQHRLHAQRQDRP